MNIVGWITAAFGALVVGVATSSVLDELLSRATQLRIERWSRDSLVRTAITAIVSLAAMVLWLWLWMNYIVG